MWLLLVLQVKVGKVASFVGKICMVLCSTTIIACYTVFMYMYLNKSSVHRMRFICFSCRPMRLSIIIVMEAAMEVRPLLKYLFVLVKLRTLP